MKAQRDSIRTRSANKPANSLKHIDRNHHIHKDNLLSYMLPLAMGLTLIVVTFGAHFPATQAGYIWDDGNLVYENSFVRSLDGLWQCWSSTEQPDYWPVTQTTFWLEWQLWGDNPQPYHVVNIALHALAAVCLWRVLKRLGIGELGAFLAAMLFAIHPVTVASVAWIAERKNVLSMVLYLLSVLTYLRFEDTQNKRWYFLSILAALAALLSKSSVAALPIVLLVCVWWRRGRITRNDLLGSAPFFAMSLILGSIELWYQHNNSIGLAIVRPENWASRIASAGWIVWFYIYKILVPTRLVMVYPRWDIDGGRALSYVPLALFIACFTILWVYRKGWARGPFAAVISFVVVLAPILGLLDMSFSEHSLVADHLQYPGMPGLMALIGGGFAAVSSRIQSRWKTGRGMVTGWVALICVIYVTLFVLTWRQAQVFKDSETLWDHTLKFNDSAWMAHYNRGNAYHMEKDYARALEHFNRVIELKPSYAKAYNNRGVVYSRTDEPFKAIKDFNKVIELRPHFSSAFHNRGIAYAMMGVHDLAIRDYTRSIELDPRNIEACLNRAFEHVAVRQHEHAIEDFTRFITSRPGVPDAYVGRAIEYYSLREYDKAWADIIKCRQMGGTPDPEFVQKLGHASGRME